MSSYLDAMEATREAYEPAATRALLSAFAAAFAGGATREQTEAALSAIYGAVIPALGGDSYTSVAAFAKKQPTAQTWDDVIEAYLRTEAAEMVSSITATTRELLRGLLAEAQAQGLGEEAAQRFIRKEWTDVSATRARMIARTEIVRASNYATQTGATLAADELGLVLDKEWIATGGERTRDTHAELDGVTVAIDEPFDVGGYAAQYPGDPALPPGESINCRCTVAYVPRAEKAVSPRVAERRADVQAKYPEYKERYGWEGAYGVLADEHHVSIRTIKRDLGR